MALSGLLTSTQGKVKRPFILSHSSMYWALLLFRNNIIFDISSAQQFKFSSVYVWFHRHMHFLPDKSPVLQIAVGSSTIHLTFERLIYSTLSVMLFLSFLCTDLCEDDFMGFSIWGLNICRSNRHALIQHENFEHLIIQYFRYDSYHCI